MFIRLFVCLMMSFIFTNLAEAALPVMTITIKNHQFNPSSLIIPAEQKVQITVDNQDSTPEEFESFDLDREQVVEGNKKITVFIGPLIPGTYNYWADYHQDSKGVIVAK